MPGVEREAGKFLSSIWNQTIGLELSTYRGKSTALIDGFIGPHRPQSHRQLRGFYDGAVLLAGLPQSKAIDWRVEVEEGSNAKK